MKRLLLVRGAEVLLFAVLLAVPLAVQSPYALGLLTLLAIYGILLIGLDVTVGYLGPVNLAQAAFLGIGAYTAASPWRRSRRRPSRRRSERCWPSRRSAWKGRSSRSRR